jgi:hypothetical protein
MNTRVDYGYAHFNFDWQWIKDKEIIHEGDEYEGILIIFNDKGQRVGFYGYKTIEYEEEE